MKIGLSIWELQYHRHVKPITPLLLHWGLKIQFMMKFPWLLGLDLEITKRSTIIIGNIRFSDSSSLLIISLYFFTLSVSVGLWNRIRNGNPSSVNSSAFSKVISRTSGIHFCWTQVYSSSKLSSEPRYVSSGSTEVFLSVLKTTIGWPAIIYSTYLLTFSQYFCKIKNSHSSSIITMPLETIDKWFLLQINIPRWFTLTH